MPPRPRPLIDEMISRFEGFEAVDHKKGYLYRRSGVPPITQFILVNQVTSAPSGFTAFLSSTILGTWSNELGGGAARATRQLKYLRLGPASSNDLLYAHENTKDTMRLSLEELAEDFSNFGEPWFRAQAEEASPGHLLYEGLAWVRERGGSSCEEDWLAIRSELESVGYHVDRLSHRSFLALKEHLRDCASQVGSSREERQAIPKMTLDLLNYAAIVRSPA